jgi:hypothetical protein
MIFLTSPILLLTAGGLGEEVPGGRCSDGVARGRSSRVEVTSSVRRMLQAIYDLLLERSAWLTFRTVDLRFDRDLGIADTQTALADIPARAASGATSATAASTMSSSARLTEIRCGSFR